MDTSTKRFEATRWPRGGTKGVALIEALIGLAVVFAGSAAIFGIHSHVMGSSAEARLQTAAMAMAQAQLETFRNWEFDQLINPDNLEGEDSETFDNPGVFGTSEVNLTWCWSIARELPANLTERASMVRISVNVARPGTACDANAEEGLARLQTFVARQDPRVAARNVAQRLVRDGEGQLVEDFNLDEFLADNPEASSQPSPTGFQEVRIGSDLVAIVDPNTNRAIVPPPGETSVKVAVISGNVFFDGERKNDYFSQSRIAGDGVAICRVDGFDPGNPESNLPKKISGADQTISYVRYSCVVADKWRREVLVGPNLDERVCVGNPELIQQGGLLMVRDQVIRGLRRFYVAREYTGYDAEKDGGNSYTTEVLMDGNDPVVDDDGDPIVVIAKRFPVGMRGSNDPDQPAAIGSVLPAGDSLWVPGGHHFFVVGAPADEGEEVPVLDEASAPLVTASGSAVVVTAGDMKCAEAMEKLEKANADQGKILVRNLSNLYCTNAKEYSTKVNELGYTGRDCISTTRISGFVNPAGAVTTDPVAQSDSFCVDMDVPANVRGAYFCGFPEDTGPIEVVGSASAAQDPLDWEHDIVSQDF